MTQAFYPESRIWTNEEIAEWRSQILSALAPQKLAAYLSEFPPDAIVGKAHKPRSCVLWAYLDRVLPHLDLILSWDDIYTELWTLGTPCLQYLGQPSLNQLGGALVPEWATQFMQGIDALSPENGACITAAEAITVLKKIAPSSVA
jgi:hypothetical protein